MAYRWVFEDAGVGPGGECPGGVQRDCGAPFSRNLLASLGPNGVCAGPFVTTRVVLSI